MEAKPMPQVHYDSYTEARNKLKDLLDAAENGQVVTVRRDAATAVVLDAERLRYFLASVVPSQAQVVQEAGGWSVFIPGLPVAADGETFGEVIAEMVTALREYAEDWQDHLLHAPNHRGNWGLVQMISLSSDEQLGKWLTGSAR
ncbi:MAG TPA: type II toxin-antitoxin system prevent-host-death family antitoxin [Streptosporangiaceae bacterium]|jgi:prevent-host-death family protein